MAKTTVSELQVLISANAAAFQAQLDAVKKQMASMGAVSNKTSGKLSAGLKGAITKYVGLGAAIAGTYKAMRAASSYIEDENLFAVSMRNAADETRAWSDQVERSVGVSGAWLRKYTGIMTNMSASMGLSHKEASKLGKNVALLSQDLASFYNISPEAAFEKMQSAMAGMPRPLQDLGIMVRDQELQQTALALGIQKTNGEFTAAQKALLTYETVIRATKNAQGDLARTLNTPANQMRMLATNARNLGVAIGTMFQPLLSVALPVLNAIVMAATSAMRALAGLFGIEFKAEASAIGDIEAGVGGIGEAADKAGGKVKKLKGQLASFDEMNTLQEQDAGGGSGGEGSAGSLPQIDWGKYNAGLDGVKNKAVAIAESIKKAFKDFGKGFNFDKIGNAFKRFFSDADKFLKPVSKILGDVWNYLKPFIYWTANDLLPAFLNALGGAINFIGAVIGSVWDSFLKPFIDTFLVPIASFTGGVIVAALNGIGDALRWIAEQEGAISTISNLLAIVGTGIAIWQGYQLALGVAHGTQLLMTGAMIAGTTATGAYAAGIGVVSAVQKAAAIATNIFSIALKALPFVGVVTGIATLVAAIILCIKHWDKIQKFVGEVVENIKRFVGNMVSVVGNFFVGLWNKIRNIFGGIGSWFGQRFNEAKTAIYGAFGNIGRWASDRFNDIKNAFGNAFNIFSDIGKNIWNGLKNGIGNIGKKIGDMFSGAVNGVKKSLGIHSPSRVFTEIGKYIDSGLVMGIDADLSKVNGAMNRLTEGFSMPEINARMNTSITSLANDKIESKAPEWAERLIKAIESNSDKHIEIKVDGATLGEITAKSINDLSFLKNASMVDF